MEAAFLSAVFKSAVNKLVRLITSEFASIIGVTKHLSELQGLFGDITSWLSAVGVRATGSGSSPNWLKELKAVVNDFDDLLYRLEAEKHKADIASENHAMANWFYTKPKSVLFRTKIAQEVKEIKKRFAKIVKQRADFNAIVTSSSTLVTHHVQPTHKTRGEMSILANTTHVFGRDEVKYSIVSKLVEADSTQERMPIVSVVGLGGSGKTTFAKYICQDSKIRQHFELVFWVHVSQKFNVENLLGKLFESVSDDRSELYTLQHMSRTISDKLSRGKFLLVLDDVWNEDKHDWEQFEQHLNSATPGSKILLTTRDGKVAEAVKSAEIFNLPLLSDDDSWKLFQHSSGWDEEALDPEFIEVGKGIVKKCAGMPIAIKSLAGNLHGKREMKYWQSLRDCNLLTDKDIQHRVLGSLMLSYFHLSDDLKQCFVLCSIFPKGYCIDKVNLISQWITHGFINSTSAGRQLEEIGNDYFDSLLKISFLQDLDVDVSNERRVTCRMHDLVHDLTRQILQDEIVLTPKTSASDHNRTCRYLSLGSCTEKVERKLFNKLRALFVSKVTFASDKPIKEGSCVRSVVLEQIMDTSDTLFVLKFEYLGYLRISNCRLQELPEGITGCWNLQALHVINCFQFAKLPESIGNLRKLRTLELLRAGNLEGLPHSIGDCHNLQSLHLISCLKFRVIPDSICKNENLRILNIVGCLSLLHLPSEPFVRLRNLETVNLSGCKSLEDLPGSFVCDELHTLKLRDLTKLTVLPQSITSLSNLEHLDLQCCSGLVELPEAIVNLKRLVVLNLEGCWNLRGLPAGFGQLTRLQTLGLFVLGDSSEHARISELESLNRLSGKLEIRIMHAMYPYDAKKAYLEKNNLHELVLSFWKMDIKMEQETRMEQAMSVLKVLEPPSGIKKLSISGYKGLHLPHWLTKKTKLSNLNSRFKQTVDLTHFPHLTAMSLCYIQNVKHLTGLVELPSLKFLGLHNFGTLESINIGPLPSLTEFNIDSMPHSLELTTAIRAILADRDGATACCNQKMQCSFPRLSDLDIRNCPKLNVNPCFPASLENLTLDNSIVWPVHHPQGDKLESPSYSNSNGVSFCSTLVKRLEIRSMEGPSCNSDWEFLQHLGALKSLEITNCDEELKQLPESMRSLTDLQQLGISNCSGLDVLPEWLGELCSIKKLKISGCKNLRELSEGMQHLISLQELIIQECDALYQLPEVGGLGGLLSVKLWMLPRLSCLPESIRSLTSLQKINITGCDAVHQLPEGLGELRYLRKIRIVELPVLTRLPESFQGLISLHKLNLTDCDALLLLPEKLGELRSLRTLIIWNLPALTCLPESIQDLTSLCELTIGCCDALTLLPESIGQLSALRSLNIRNCRGLTSLPHSIKHLAALQVLCMTGNPHLSRRYMKGVGKDWHLISHIHHVSMDGMRN
ncbi:hypothetical protein ACQJBY_062633 [Aegilops geniculata]